jgi:hypothetical protein
MKTLILPIKKLPYFTDYLNNSQADYPLGNLLFPRVKAERRS